mmetsp:Transcript_31623/g.80652  ORF Transcript_31623/g.80652 Transcript_31623/m.80652 type:complete len:248 (+) Transcript_31623:3368-4111(+)
MGFAVNPLVAPYHPQHIVGPHDQPRREDDPPQRVVNAQKEVKGFPSLHLEKRGHPLQKCQQQPRGEKGGPVKRERTAHQQRPARHSRRVLVHVAADLLKPQHATNELVASCDGTPLGLHVPQREVHMVVPADLLAVQVSGARAALCACVHTLPGQTCIKGQPVDQDVSGREALVVRRGKVLGLQPRVVQCCSPQHDHDAYDANESGPLGGHAMRRMLRLAHMRAVRGCGWPATDLHHHPASVAAISA